MSEEKHSPPPNYLTILQRFMDSDLIDEAQKKIKEWKLQVKIENGRLIDVSNTTESWLRRFVTSDSKMMAMRDNIRKLAKIDDEVLIIGETGTGKEIIARAIHGDREGRFIAVNCAGIVETLVESILFGHTKGSFTGAIETRQGLMKLADSGSIFFDEIGELPLAVQAKLLRALQERVITKVGGDKEEPITCRVIAATHRDLQKMVDKEEFRMDLYARMSTFTVHLTPLRERDSDFVPIIQSLKGGDEFLKAMDGRKKPKTPFNVRSLQQFVKRYTVLGELPNE